MPLPLVPIAIMSLAGVAYGVNKMRDAKNAVTVQTIAERRVIYETALNTCKEPEKLKKLADVFEQVGQKPEAIMLRKRADLMLASPETKKQRRESLDKGLASSNKEGVLALADAFEEIGATAAAEKLRNHASELDIQTNPRIEPQEESNGV